MRWEREGPPFCSVLRRRRGKEGQSCTLFLCDICKQMLILLLLWLWFLPLELIPLVRAEKEDGPGSPPSLHFASLCLPCYHTQSKLSEII